MLVFCRLVGSSPDGHQYGSPTALYKFVQIISPNNSQWAVDHSLQRAFWASFKQQQQQQQ